MNLDRLNTRVDRGSKAVIKTIITRFPLDAVTKATEKPRRIKKTFHAYLNEGV